MNRLPELSEIPDTATNAEFRAEYNRVHLPVLRELARDYNRRYFPKEEAKRPEWSNTVTDDGFPPGTVERLSERLVRIKADRGWETCVLEETEIRKWFCRHKIEMPDISQYFPSKEEDGLAD